MENKETLVTDVAENVENPTEETQPKTYTQEEVDAIVGKAKARAKAKIEKEYGRKYGQLESVLKAGTGKENVDEMTEAFTKFYESKGVKINKPTDYSAYAEKDVETLAKADADDIIRQGYEEVVDEVDRLAELGVENMTAREKAVFKTLAEHRKNTEQSRELTKIGVSEEVYNSKEFKEFASMFRPDIPMTKVYEEYTKTQPKKEVKTMGSMKQTHAEGGVKDYYSPEEISRLTEEELADPKVWAVVRRCMTGG